MITVQKGWHDTPETLLTLCGDLRFRLRERIQIEIFPSINRERSFRDLLGKLSKSDLFDGERKVLLLLLFISVLSYSMLAIYIAQRRRFVILYENSSYDFYSNLSIDDVTRWRDIPRFISTRPKISTRGLRLTIGERDVLRRPKRS